MQFILQAYEARINGVQALSDQLKAENFHRVDWITSSAEKVKDLWVELLKLLDFRSSQLQKHLNLHKIFQEMIYIIDWMDELKVRSWLLLTRLSLPCTLIIR